MRCDACGVESACTEAFHFVRRPYRRSGMTLCPPCWQQRDAQLRKRVYVCWVVLTAAAALALLAGSGSYIGVNFLLLYVLLALSLLAHELAHVIAARLMGLRVFHVVVGIGRVIFERRIHGVAVRFSLLPVVGFVLAYQPDIEWARSRRWLFILAGPLVNVLLLALASTMMTPGTSGRTAWERTIAVWPLLSLSNIILLAVALWPWKLQGPSVPGGSDGFQLVAIPCLSRPQVAQWQAIYCQSDAHEHYLAGRYAALRDSTERALNQFPENWMLQHLRALALLAQRDFHGAREQMLALKDRLVPDVPPDQQESFAALLYNNTAWADLMIGTPEAIVEADRFSAAAIAMAPWLAAVQGTRGAVLVVTDELAEAAPLLRQGLANAGRDANRAAVICFMALAEHKLGNTEGARALLADARRLDPGCEAIDCVEAELAAPAYC